MKRYFPSQDCIYDLFRHFTLILLASKHLRRLDYHSLICGGKGKRLNRLWRTTQWITCDNGRKKRKRRETAFPAFHLLFFSPFRLSAFPKSALRIYILKNRTENRFPDVPYAFFKMSVLFLRKIYLEQFVAAHAEPLGTLVFWTTQWSQSNNGLILSPRAVTSETWQETRSTHFSHFQEPK